MVSWSKLVGPPRIVWKFQNLLQHPDCKNAVPMQLRKMSGEHHLMTIQPSRFQWNKFKDLLHFYIMLGVIPLSAIILGMNIFVGPAKLEEIPVGYEPKYWEYHKHPISRFIARYMYPSPQQDYEKFLHHLNEENEKAQLRLLESKIRAKMSERKDYQAYYYRPALGNYLRVSKEAADELKNLRGDS